MALSEDLMSKCSEQMSAYKAACEEDPKLKSFDASLQQQTNKMIDSLTFDTETGSVSPHDVHKKKFKANGDPFNGQVLTNQFELIKKQQESLLEEVTQTMKKIEEEITNLKKGNVIANIVFGAVFAVVAVASIALIVIFPGTIAAYGALAAPLVALGWPVVNTILGKKIDNLNKQLESLKKVKEIGKTVEKGIKTNEEASETVSILVDGLDDRIQNMLELVDKAIENEEDEGATILVMKIVPEKVEKLTKKIKEVGESVEDHSKLVAEARLHVLQKINR
ncbi:predicted protein [Arabidopsis lyrata subsp. lyrata]|uniref:Predicted protein n=1 Tax=Arabidopsis lyrata subsp. lyrata TaxID=81972 RepID=D7LPR3_ARALL|nr:predicted protein [Arabidopsis lyrata subsp. lyrata]